MHFTNRSTISKQVIQSVLSALLAVVLVGLVAGCGAAGANGDGDESGIESPAAPSGIEGTSGDSEIGLDWGTVDAADSYSVYRATESGVETSGEPLEEKLSQTSYTDTGAENGTTYYYRVTAVKTNGEEKAESDGSNEVEKTPFDNPPDRPS